jgi:hypothetical protein
MSHKKGRIQAIFIDRDGTIGETAKDLNPNNYNGPRKSDRQKG